MVLFLSERKGKLYVVNEYGNRSTQRALGPVFFYIRQEKQL